MNAFKEVISGSRSLITGLSLTIREFFKPTITVHYPHQTLPMPDRYRGHIELTWLEENGRANCTSCNLCAKACPSECITVEGIKPEGEKKKTVTTYNLNFTLCSLCGACIEVCPFDAIHYTKRYNLASTTNEYRNMDLVERYKQQALSAGKTPYIPEVPAAAAPVAAAAQPAKQ